MPTRSLCAALLAAACLLSATTGCCVKRGFIFRGDFSLECNRVPWMTSHGPVYEEDSPAKPSEGGQCAVKAAPGPLGEHSLGEPSPPQPGPPGHTRLHPIPTGPVFGPMPGHPLPLGGEEEGEEEGHGAEPTLPIDAGPAEDPPAEEVAPPAKESDPPAGSSVTRPRRPTDSRRTNWTFVAPRDQPPATKSTRRQIIP